mgnify:CR=1 FL=1
MFVINKNKEKESTEQTPVNEIQKSTPEPIEKADDFIELYKAMEQEEIIIGSEGKKYEVEELIRKIESLRREISASIHDNNIGEDKKTPKDFWENLIKNDTRVLSITRTKGLRRKVAELLIKEAKEKEGFRRIKKDTKED